MNYFLFLFYLSALGVSGKGYYEHYFGRIDENYLFCIFYFIYPLIFILIYFNQVINIRHIKTGLKKINKFDNLSQSVRQLNDVLRKIYNNALMLRHIANFFIAFTIGFGVFLLSTK